MGGSFASTCYATSHDGIHWEKPSLDAVEPGTNIVHKGARDSCTVWLDQNDKDPARRFKMFWVTKNFHMELYFSADGIHWGQPLASSSQTGDRSTAFLNPFRKVWVLNLRHGTGDVGRCRQYWENADVLQAVTTFKQATAPLWIGADNLEIVRTMIKESLRPTSDPLSEINMNIASRIQVLGFSLLAAGVALSGGCGGTPAAPGQAPPAAIVEMHFHSFEPKSVTIHAGDSVLWKNTTMVPFVYHTVTADPNKCESPAHFELPPGVEPFDSGHVASGGTYQRIFTVPGKYKYFCEPHESKGMLGEIIVLAVGEAAPAPAAQPATEPASAPATQPAAP